MEDVKPLHFEFTTSETLQSRVARVNVAKPNNSGRRHRDRPRRTLQIPPSANSFGGIDLDFDVATRKTEDRAYAVGFSIFVHVLVLLVLQFFWIFDWPRQSEGFVIHTEFVSGDDGAESLDAAIIHSTDATDGDDRRQGPASTAAVADFWKQAVQKAESSPTGGGSGARSGGVGFFGTRGVGNSFIFIIDCSGSMEGPRLDRAKVELNRAIRQLRPHQRFTVIFFEGVAHPFLDPKPTQLVPAILEWKERAQKWVKAREAGGATEPLEALQIALRLQPDVIFFLTDGEIPEETPEQCVQTNYSSTVIHTTAFHSQDGTELLAQIASDSGGTYRYVGAESVIPKDVAAITKAQKREAAATRYFEMTKALLKEGRRNTVRRRIKLIMREYSDLDVSKEARVLLKNMGRRFSK